MKNIKKYKEYLSNIKSTKKILSEERDELLESISRKEQELKNLTEAREIVSTAGIIAQDTTKEVFESLVTQALQTIFGEEYTFKLESRYIRNQPEMEMFVIENGIKFSPKDEKGGAILDIISFASRIVSWAIKEPKSDNILLLDEPFRCLHKSVLPFLAQLMQDISRELNLQIIYITHEKQLIEVINNSDRDRTFLVEQFNGISEVRRIT